MFKVCCRKCLGGCFHCSIILARIIETYYILLARNHNVNNYAFLLFIANYIIQQNKDRNF